MPDCLLEAVEQPAAVEDTTADAGGSGAPVVPEDSIAPGTPDEAPADPTTVDTGAPVESYYEDVEESTLPDFRDGAGGDAAPAFSDVVVSAYSVWSLDCGQLTMEGIIQC